MEIQQNVWASKGKLRAATLISPSEVLWIRITILIPHHTSIGLDKSGQSLVNPKQHCAKNNPVLIRVIASPSSPCSKSTALRLRKSQIPERNVPSHTQKISRLSMLLSPEVERPFQNKSKDTLLETNMLKCSRCIMYI